MSSNDPLAGISTTATPQDQPIPGRDMVPNAAGGYVFAKDLWRQLEDFIILGTGGGTYYISERDHTMRNFDVVLEAVKADGARAVRLATGISISRPPRAPRNNGALFVLAAADAFGDEEARKAVKEDLWMVARTTDHKSMFFGYRKQLKGKTSGTGLKMGRSTKTAIARLFTRPAVESVAYSALKARQRKTPAGENLTIRDLLRVSHPKPESPLRRVLLGWLAGNTSDEEAAKAIPLIAAWLKAQAAETPAEAIALVQEHKLPWEFLPPKLNASSEVWDELVNTVGLTALMRNLGRITEMGTLKPLGDATDRVVKRLENPEGLLKARIHPIDPWIAGRVYAAGISQPHGSKTARLWEPVPAVLDGLEAAYLASFGNVTPAGKRFLIAVDASGSMNQIVMVGGTPVGTAYEVSNAMASMIAKIEKNVHVIDVDTAGGGYGARVTNSRVTARTNLREIRDWRPSGGGTDMAAPFDWALKQDLNVDGIIVFTDDETWANSYHHPAQAIEAYRQRVNSDVKVVVASLTAAGYGIADPDDAAVLNIAGLDGSLPQLITEWMR